MTKMILDFLFPPLSSSFLLFRPLSSSFVLFPPLSKLPSGGLLFEVPTHYNTSKLDSARKDRGRIVTLYLAYERVDRFRKMFISALQGWVSRQVRLGQLYRSRPWTMDHGPWTMDHGPFIVLFPCIPENTTLWTKSKF